ncbi:MAG: lamin tail domain-containing protein, partial [Thermoplasmata archaeon]|nr:lamin tail domain-containing protein [Thermoplasmata archaeon]
WHAWESVSSIKVQYKNDQLEAQANLYQIDNGVNILFHIADAYGMEDYSDAIISNEYGAVVIEQIGTNSPLLIKSFYNNILELKITAFGRDMEIENIGFSKGARIFNRNGMVVEFPLVITKSETEYYLVKIYIGPEEETGSVIDFKVIEVTLSQGSVTVVGNGIKAYVERVPREIKIDGLFNDWYDASLNSVIKTDTENDVLLYLKSSDTSFYNPKNQNNIDITNYGVAKSTETISFYLKVKSVMLGGSCVPSMPIVMKPAAKPTSSIIQGGTQAELPLPINILDDCAYIFLDIDQNANTGYNPTDWFPIGADYVIEIKGQNGEITSSYYSSFNGDYQGDFNWVPMYTVSAAADRTQLETQIELAKIGTAIENIDIYFHMVGWNDNREYSDNMIDIDGDDYEFKFVEVTGTRGVTSGAVLNEVYPDDGSNNAEWLEIYNADQNLNGWDISDFGGTPIFTFSSDPGTGYIIVDQADWGGGSKISESMILYLRDSSDNVQDTVLIASIANDASYARYKDYDGYPLDSASGPFFNAGDWYEESSGSITKGSANSTEIPEMQILLLPILIVFIFIGVFQTKKNGRESKFVLQ